MVVVLWAEKKYDAAVTLEQFWNCQSFGDVQSE